MPLHNNKFMYHDICFCLINQLRMTNVSTSYHFYDFYIFHRLTIYGNNSTHFQRYILHSVVWMQYVQICILFFILTPSKRLGGLTITSLEFTFLIFYHVGYISFVRMFQNLVQSYRKQFHTVFVRAYCFLILIFCTYESQNIFERFCKILT